jgi:hypothetical protein
MNTIVETIKIKEVVMKTLKTVLGMGILVIYPAFILVIVILSIL